MAQYIVKQSVEKFGIFCDDKDDFIVRDLTKEELVEYLLEEKKKEIESFVDLSIERIENGEDSPPISLSFKELVEMRNKGKSTHILVIGSDDIPNRISMIASELGCSLNVGLHHSLDMDILLGKEIPKDLVPEIKIKEFYEENSTPKDIQKNSWKEVNNKNKFFNKKKKVWRRKV